MRKRILSIIVVSAIVLSLIPIMTFATVINANSITTFLNAINNAQNGDIVMLTADIALVDSFAEIKTNKNIILDLNGKTISISGTGLSIYDAILKLESGAGVTVIDSSGGSGVMSSNGCRVLLNKGNGAINIEGGTLMSNGSGDAVISNYSYGPVNVSGGTVRGAGSGDGAIYNNVTGKITISGTANVISSSYNTIYSNNNSSQNYTIIEIKGGTVSNSNPSGIAIYSRTQGTVVISGGTVLGTTGLCADYGSAPVIVSGGSINAIDLSYGSTLKNTTGTNVEKYTLKIQGRPDAFVTALNLPNSYAYGVNNVRTNASGDIYVWLPANQTGLVTATVGGVTYYGIIAANAATLTTTVIIPDIAAALSAPASLTYDGNPKTYTANISGGTPTLGTHYNIRYTGTGYNSTTAPTNAGTYTATFELTVTGQQSYSITTPPSVNFIITKVTPTVSISANPSSPQTYPTSIIFTATVAGVTTPTGTVDFYQGANKLNPTPVTLSSGVATFNWTSNAGSFTDIKATYTGDVNFTAKTSSAIASYNINKANPTIADLTYSLASKTYNKSAQPISVTSSKTGIGAITNVYYNGSATPPMNFGTYAITVDIAIGTNYNGATLSLGNYTINKATPTLTAPISITPFDYGITLADDMLFGGTAKNPLNGSLSVEGSWKFTAQNQVPTAGTTSASVTFTPTDTANYNSNTVNVALTVNKKPVTITVTNTSPIFDNTVKNISFTPNVLAKTDFTVKYYVVDLDTNKVNFGAEVANPRMFGKYIYVIDFADSQANYTINNKASITYLANQAIPTGGNVGIMEIVVQALPTKKDTTVAMTTPANINYGENTSLMATVTKTDGTEVISGTVTFTNGNDVIGTAVVKADGSATYAWKKPSGSTYSDINASYSGDSNYKPSDTNVAQTLVVLPIEQVITANDVAKNYGESEFLLLATTNGDGIISYAVKNGNDVVELIGGIVKILKEGIATITVSTSATNNYNQATKDIIITIGTASAVVWASNTSFLYDGLQKSITALSYPVIATTVVYYAVNSDNTVNTTANVVPQEIGKYLYVIDTTDTKYTISNKATIVLGDNVAIPTGSNVGILEISESAQPMISFTNPLVNKTYGDAEFTETATGGIEGATINYKSIDTTIADVNESTGAVTIKKPGTTTIVATSQKPGYADAMATYALIIAKQNVTVTANNNLKIYGDLNPTNSISYSTTVEPAKIDESSLSYIENYTQFSPAGTSYLIEPTGLISDYYSFTYKKGTMTINKREVDVTASITKLYDGKSTDKLTNLSFTNIVNGDVVKGSANVVFDSSDTGATSATLLNIVIDIGTSNYELKALPTKNISVTTNKAPITFVGTNNTYYYDENGKQAGVMAYSTVTGLAIPNSEIDVLYNGNDSFPTDVGTYTVTARAKSTSTNYISTLVTVGELEIKQSSQAKLTINGVPSGTIQYGDTFTLANAGGSGTGMITYAVTSGNATITGDVLKITGTEPLAITATKAADANYTEQTAVASFTAQKRVVTPTATAVNKVYNGDTSVVTEIQLSNVLPSDTLTATGTGNTVDANVANGKVVNVTNISLSDNSKYVLSTTTTQTIVDIARKSISATVTAQDKVYDATEKATANAVLNDAGADDVIGVVDANFEGADAGTNKDVNYTVTLSGTKADNYKLDATATGKIIANIDKATVRFNGSNDTYIYDGNEHRAIISAIVTRTGLPFTVYKVKYNGMDAIPKNADTYNVSVEIVDENYIGTFEATILIIDSANQTPLAVNGVPNDQIRYKDTFKISAIGGSGSGQVKYSIEYGDDILQIDQFGKVKVIGVGNAVIKVVKESDGNFNEQSSEVSVTTYKKKLNLTVLTTNVPYNGYEQDVTVLTDDNDFSATMTDGERTILNPDSIFANYVEIANPSNTTAKEAGYYQAIVKVADSSPYYTSDNATGFITITKAPFTIKVDDKEKFYGQENPEFTLDYNLLGTDTVSDITLPTINCEADKKSTVGTYNILASGNISANYDVTYQKGTLSVKKKQLTIIAEGKTKNYSKPNPAGTVTYVGFDNGDDKTTLSGTLAFAFNNFADGHIVESAPGTYSIIPSGLKSENYDIVFVNGTLTVNELPVTVSTGTARASYLTFGLDEEVAGLQASDISVTLNGTPITLTSVIPSANNKSYTINGTFEVGSKYDIAIAKPNYTFNTIEATPVKPSSGGGGGGAGTKYYNEIKTVEIEPKEPEIPVEPETPAQQSQFIDIKGHWAEYDIDFVAKLGIFNGTSEAKFSPDDNITRGMFVTVLGRLAEADTSHSNALFIDVDGNEYYAPFVAWAAENGIIKGIGENKFEADRIITREEMTVIISRFITFAGYNIELQNNIQEFKDASKIGDWAKDSVEFIRQLGIINGNENNEFNPKNTSTRAEVATMLNRLVKRIGI